MKHAHPEEGDKMESRGVLRGGAAAAALTKLAPRVAHASVEQRAAAAAAAPATCGEKNLPKV